MRHQKGFTLIELMIVVVIVGIISAIAMPRYREHLLKKDRALAQQEMRNIAMRLEAHKSKNFSYIGFPKDAVDTPVDNTRKTYQVKPDISDDGFSWSITGIRKDTQDQAQNYDMLLTSDGDRCMTTVPKVIRSDEEVTTTECDDSWEKW